MQNEYFNYSLYDNSTTCIANRYLSSNIMDVNASHVNLTHHMNMKATIKLMQELLKLRCYYTEFTMTEPQLFTANLSCNLSSELCK